jgi:hypothetical protein
VFAYPSLPSLESLAELSAQSCGVSHRRPCAAAAVLFSANLGVGVPGRPLSLSLALSRYLSFSLCVSPRFWSNDQTKNNRNPDDGLRCVLPTTTAPLCGDSCTPVPAPEQPHRYRLGTRRRRFHSPRRGRRPGRRRAATEAAHAPPQAPTGGSGGYQCCCYCRRHSGATGTASTFPVAFSAAHRHQASASATAVTSSHGQTGVDAVIDLLGGGHRNRDRRRGADTSSSARTGSRCRGRSRSSHHKRASRGQWRGAPKPAALTAAPTAPWSECGLWPSAFAGRPPGCPDHRT